VTGLAFVATLSAALACGLVAGIFLAFSSFVMAALRRLPPAQGIAAMKSINVLAVTPVFMTVLFGAGALCLGLAVWALIDAGGSTRASVLAGAAAYLAGAIGVTVAANVPMNDRLADVDPRVQGDVAYWDEYVERWTAWNHLRTAAALTAAAALTIALTV